MERENRSNGPGKSASVTGGRGRCCGLGITLPLLFLLTCASSFSQTIDVYSPTHGSISNNDYVFIDANSSYDWPMPDLTISFTGLTSCDTVSLDIKMAWNDPNTAYETQFDTGTVTMEGTDTWLLEGSAWSNEFGTGDHSEGGYATLSYQINGGTTQYFYFNIGGLNPDQGVADNFYKSLSLPIVPSAPWFWGNILAQESSGQGWGARQYYVNDCLVSDPINVNDCPLVVGNPDGIGISQVDGEENPGNVDDSVYWNYEENMIEGLTILYSKQSESQSDWANYYQTSGYTDPSPYDTKLSSYQYCSFVATQPIGNHGFGDADWIQDYNGHSNQHWYLWWTSTGWVFKYNTSENGYNYVPSVCNSAPY